jgi:hypothetical protein
MTAIWSGSASIYQNFFKWNEMKRIVHDFLLSFIINNEQIEPNLVHLQINMIKYNVDREILIIFKKFWIGWSHF